MTNHSSPSKKPTSSNSVHLNIKPIESKIVINKKNWVDNHQFSCRGKVHLINEIVSIQDNSQTIRFNYIPTYKARVVIKLRDGTYLYFKSHSSFFESKKVKHIKEAYSDIQRNTFKARYETYMQELKQKGYFEYNNYKIYENGDISHASFGEPVNIPESAVINPVIVGWEKSFGLNSRYDPNEINIYHRPHNKKKDEYFTFHVKENRDVIFAIVQALAESKGGTIIYPKWGT